MPSTIQTPLPVWYLLLLLHISLSFAGFINRTIDDEYGDNVTGEKLAYYPPDSSGFVQGSTCSRCLINLNTSIVWRGTWHDCSQHPYDPEIRTITAHFTGTAVYVYTVLSEYRYGHDLENKTVTYLTFEIDGKSVGEFFHDTYDGTQYHTPVLAHEGLSDAPHTLVIRIPPGRDGKSWSWVLFDYIQYTTSDSSSSSSSAASPSPSSTASPSLSLRPGPPLPTSASAASPSSASVSVAAIVGGTVGGVAILFVAAVVAFHLMRTRRVLVSHAGSALPIPFHGERPMPFEPSLASTAAETEVNHGQPSNHSIRMFYAGGKWARSHHSGRSRSLDQPSSTATDLSSGARSQLRVQVAHLKQQMMRIQELVHTPPGHDMERPELGEDALVREKGREVLRLA